MRWARQYSAELWIGVASTVLAAIATLYSFMHQYTISYGDAESHLNIAKRVVDSLTPGFAQLGGIWLPLPHILLMPFVLNDYMWRTGLAGSVVSGAAFVISAIYIYKLTRVITGNKGAAIFSSAVFILNPNILYLQTTPMTELTLVAFFALSSYYFVRFLESEGNILMLIMAAGFGFYASLSRYDGWALVLMEAGVIFLYYFPWKIAWAKSKGSVRAFFAPRSPEPTVGRFARLEARLILFCSPAFLGIVMWLLWGYLILGDPLYFTHSQFSANSQQQSWHARGELPAYHNPWVSFLYYFVTTMSNGGVVVFLIGLAGLIAFSLDKKQRHRFFVILVLLVPFFFNVLTLFLGQSVIFIPGLTPLSFEWTLFNVRYGTMMVPAIALFAGYLFYKGRTPTKVLLCFLVAFQCVLFTIGFSPILALEDGVSGLSSATAKIPDAQNWLATHYDYGLILTDDFARTISIIRTPIPMKNVIYIGNKPYWEESLVAPEKYARWIVIQRNDVLWQNILADENTQGRLYKYFNRVYTAEEIQIFRRIDSTPGTQTTPEQATTTATTTGATAATSSPSSAPASASVVPQ